MNKKLYWGVKAFLFLLIFLTCYMAGRISRSGAAAAVDWDAANKLIHSLPQRKKEQALAAALSELSLVNLEKATEEVKKLPPQLQQEAFSGIANSLAKQNPTRALEWLATHASAESATQTAHLTIPELIAQNHPIQEYIIGMQNGPVKDAALSSLIKNTVGFSGDHSFVNYENTINLADNIHDRQQKETSLNTILTSWNKRAPVQAKAWIEASTLPETIKQAQLKAVDDALRSKTQETPLLDS